MGMDAEKLAESGGPLPVVRAHVQPGTPPASSDIEDARAWVHGRVANGLTPDPSQPPYLILWHHAFGSEPIGRTSRLVLPDWWAVPHGYLAIAGYDEDVQQRGWGTSQGAVDGDLDEDRDWFAQARREAEQSDRRGL